MNKTIEIKKVSIDENIIEVDYDIAEELQQFFNLENKFRVQYSENISDVPEEVAIIPFVTNILPIIWLTDSTVKINKIDENFFESLENVKKGFADMYPNVEFKGNILADEIIKSEKNQRECRSSIFFSGGVDSTSSLISVEKEKPILITVWGSDIWDYDEEGWKEAKKTVEKFGKEFELENKYLKSNFRKFINEQKLNENFQEKLNDSWWHGIQHGIGLLGHVAPYAFKYNITTHYIPATYTKNDIGVTCASYPTIDESLEYVNCKIIHEGFDKTRQQKIKNICNYANVSDKDIKLRVCYMERGTKLNCCKCEKCYRTILAILSEKQDPEKYGFEISNDLYENIKNTMKKQNLLSNATIGLWKEIQQNFIKDKKYWKKQKNLKWILKYNFEKNK